MSFVLGVVLFALGIGISIALHEAGHMYTAKAFGMKVRRYFIGFGPTLFSFRRGETEYGLKAIPAGGFCDIVGMTAMDELPDPADRKRAFYRFATWKRVVVLSGGIAVNFVLGTVVLYGAAVSTGLPNIDAGQPVVGEVSACIGATGSGACPPGAPAPARDAGLQPGDRILAVGGTEVESFAEVSEQTQQLAGPTAFLIERDGQQRSLVIDIARVPVSSLMTDPAAPDELVGAIGVAPPPEPRLLTFGALEAVPATFDYTGTLFANVWEALLTLPERIPPLLAAIAGEERSYDTPVSVVGASILGGDAAQLDQWSFFIFLLAALNFFLGAFNMLPLLPLDGGHITVNLYERARNGVRRLTGRPDGPPVDYTRLLPLTYVVFLVMLAFGALTLTADIVNPLRLGQ